MNKIFGMVIAVMVFCAQAGFAVRTVEKVNRKDYQQLRMELSSEETALLDVIGQNKDA